MKKRNSVLLIGIVLFSVIFFSCESKDKYPESSGVWKFDFMDEVLHLKKLQGDYVIIRDNPKIGEMTKEVNQDPSNALKFNASDSGRGDYYIIVNGYLEIWDNEGMIDRSAKILKRPEFN
ncbi:MAG: hypothetical protein PF638_14720 [Candidatus Delongbacteria bacterium]|jgi:hypothetical protein|nr:hypothetical protein [Candidatus Delongbacteria bacterium]